VSRGVRETQEIGDLYALMSLRSGLPNLLWLVRDDRERATFEMHDAIRAWSRAGFHVQHLFHLIATCNVGLYGSDDVLDAVREVEKPITDSILLKVHLNRVLYEDVRSRALLGRAARTGDHALAAEAEKRAKAMLATEHPWSSAMYHLVAAQSAHLRGRPANALASLKRAHAMFVSSEMHLHASSSGAVLARLLGGEEGKRLARASDEYFASQRIKKPSNFVRMFAPGFDAGA